MVRTSKGKMFLTSSGANAFYSLFREASRQAREEKRGIWIQLGWLYIDTIEVMALLTSRDEKVLTLHSPQDFSKLEKLFREHGSQIAGVVTEFPTNPLLQCCDLEKVRGFCNDYDSLLVVDPTMVSPKTPRFPTMPTPWSTASPSMRTGKDDDGKPGFPRIQLKRPYPHGTCCSNPYPTLPQRPAQDGRANSILFELHRKNQCHPYAGCPIPLWA